MTTVMKTIDFTRPTKFTPDHERRLHGALAGFCRTSSTRLSAELRLPIEIEMAETTQLTWANAHDRLASSALCAVVELQPAETEMLLAADLGFILTGIESLLSGPCEETPPERRLTEIDLALARRLFEGLLGQMTVVWRDLAGVELKLAELDTQLETAQVAPVSEPTLAMTMQVRVRGNEFALTLLVPHRAIAPAEARILGRGADEEGPGPAERQHLREALAGVEIDLCAEIAGREIPASQALLLQPGDTLDLGARVAEGLALCAEGVPVLRAKPGRSGSRRAVQVTEAMEPDAAQALAQLAAALPAASEAAPSPGPADPSLTRALGQVPVRAWAELGRARLSLATVIGLAPGAVVELDRHIEDPIDLYVNGFRFAQGSLIITEDEDWAVGIEAITGAEGG